MIEILDPNAVSSHPNGPHFLLTSQDRAREDAEGNTRIALSRKKMLGWLAQDPNDRLRIEAVALISNNAGLTFLNGRWLAGERQPAMLFSAVTQRVAAGDGTKFFDLQPIHACRIFGHERDFPGLSGSYATIESHLKELLALHGLVPNMERIKPEFCRTCTQSVTIH